VNITLQEAIKLAEHFGVCIEYLINILEEDAEEAAIA